MKKVFSLLAVAAAALSLAACGGKEDPTTTPSKSTPSIDVVDPTQNSTGTSTQTEDTNQGGDLEDELVYTTKLLLPDGSTYTGKGVLIQYCNIETASCLKPLTTDKNGVVTFTEDKGIDPEADYIVHIMPSETEFLAKYAYNINAYKANAHNKDLAIQLYDRVALGTEAGTLKDPKKINKLGGYTLTLDAKGFVEFEFTAPKSGKLTIEGFGAQISATNAVETSLFFKGEANTDFTPVEVKKGGVGKNFKYEFTAEANKTYKFAVGSANAGSYPATFDFVIA